MEKSFFDVAASKAGKRNQEHPLRYTWKVFFSKKLSRHQRNHWPTDYKGMLQTVCTFKTLEQFWRVYSHMKRPHLLENCKVHIFKDGIQPLWEDDSNRLGGEWQVRLERGTSSRSWENVLLMIIGEQFEFSEDICGVVLALRETDDQISIWFNNTDERKIESIKETFEKSLHISPVNLQFLKHIDIIATVQIDKTPE